MSHLRLKTYVFICVISNLLAAIAVYFLAVPEVGGDQISMLMKLLIIVIILTILHQGSWVPFIRGLKKWARLRGDEEGAKAGLHRIFQIIWRNAYAMPVNTGRNCFIIAVLSFGIMELILAYYLIVAVLAVLKPGMWAVELFFYLRILSVISAITVLISIRPFLNYISMLTKTWPTNKTI